MHLECVGFYLLLLLFLLLLLPSRVATHRGGDEAEHHRSSMQKHRSFSCLKPTRLLLFFSFAIPSTFLFVFIGFLRLDRSALGTCAAGDCSADEARARITEETRLAEPNDSSGEQLGFAESSVATVASPESGGEVHGAECGPGLKCSVKTEEEEDTARSFGVLGVAFAEENKGNSEAGSNAGNGSIESKHCDVSKGSWVYDPSYPLYTNNSCPFIDVGFSCQTNGRPDTEYMKWRWQPHGCSIFPRFDPVKMLELIRGKRLVFVGDSLNRNQWESMLCLLRQALVPAPGRLPVKAQEITKEKSSYNFKFVDYDCSVEYYSSHYLVQEGGVAKGRRSYDSLRLDKIDRSSSGWLGADILVFNSAHWWSHHKTKSGLNYFQEGEKLHRRLDVKVAYRKALSTCAAWVDRHVVPNKTRVFFRSPSPSHFRGREWNSGGHCKESTRPSNASVFDPSYKEKMAILTEVVELMKSPVTILDITGLSGYRIDGHPSVYGRRRSGEGGGRKNDCSHWCLPGIPDAWNELLHFHLLSREEEKVFA